MARFLHVSDTHLGSRQYMSDMREQDFFDAFTESVDIAIREKVDFIVHSGDLFDNWSPSNRSLMVFRDQAMRLRDAGIPTFLIMGDHDRPKRTDYPAAQIFDFMGIKLLGKEEAEFATFRSEGEEILIAGISNMKGLRRERLPLEYSRADEKASGYESSILLSHQAVKGFLHDDAIEVQKDELPKNFTYLAFGHVHDSALQINRRPIFSYAGSTEMKSDREINAYLKNGKGVNLVDISHGSAKVERLRLNSVRPQFLIETDYENYLTDIEETLRKYSVLIGQKKPLVSIKIFGDADRESVKSKLSTFDNLVFRPPFFIPRVTEVEMKTGINNASDFIREFFSDDPDISKLASDYFREFRNSREDARAVLEKELEQYGAKEQ
ncbi:MAG: exonuclease SbcCD subunit D [Candidatus Thermoplasmatota archaeon]|nr:exonuclease SbcCD subunit D [Candidatus Thermoplasmatota archaeon]